jgi:hypothetical protein
MRSMKNISWTSKKFKILKVDIHMNKWGRKGDLLEGDNIGDEITTQAYIKKRKGHADRVGECSLPRVV